MSDNEYTVKFNPAMGRHLRNWVNFPFHFRLSGGNGVGSARRYTASIFTEPKGKI
jgi:hypothetical protein